MRDFAPCFLLFCDSMFTWRRPLLRLFVLLGAAPADRVLTALPLHPPDANLLSFPRAAGSVLSWSRVTCTLPRVLSAGWTWGFHRGCGDLILVMAIFPEPFLSAPVPLEFP